ncbi:MAG TPA: nuclear transport factor 2 family protein [Bryobacteraceae bacterium]|nr:nuclear transport factor 2 family protein [Bryobacteraceae bacterium]
MGPQSASALRKTNQIFEEEVVIRGNFNALESVYTENARILPPGAAMIEGRPAIKEFWQGAAASLNVTSIQLETVDVEFLGDTAVEIGRAMINTQSGSMAVKYVVVWKQEDGAWKWHIDIWNPS